MGVMLQSYQGNECLCGYIHFGEALCLPKTVLLLGICLVIFHNIPTWTAVQAPPPNPQDPLELPQLAPEELTACR